MDVANVWYYSLEPWRSKLICHLNMRFPVKNEIPFPLSSGQKWFCFQKRTRAELLVALLLIEFILMVVIGREIKMLWKIEIAREMMMEIVKERRR